MKKQLKKSLSLFLAVLMLMSCWVWVAPEKAEAADANAEAGKYYVRVYGNLTDNICCSVSNDQWTVNWKKNNGRDGGATGSTILTTSYGIASATANDKTFAEGWVDGWPTSLVTYHKSSSSRWFHDCAGRFEKLRLQVKNIETGAWTDLHDVQEWNFNEDGTGHTFNTKTEAWPKVNSIGTTSNLSLTIPKIGTGATVTSSSVQAGIYDQYAVRLQGDIPDSYYTAGTDGAAYSQTEHGVWTSVSSGNCTVKATEQAQIGIQGNAATASQTIRVYATKAGVQDAKHICDVTLSYPKYTIEVNGDGATPIAKGKADVSLSNDTVTSDVWKFEGIYGAEAKPYPKDATKEGYTFKGFWTGTQPSTGAASYNAKEAEYVEPCSDTEFNQYVAAGGTQDGNYVTYEGKRYYKAGEKWTNDSYKVSGEKAYNGWWLSKDINVKFYDIDGEFKGEHAVKYGQTQSDITWPTSDYSQSKPYVNGAFTARPVAGQWVNIDGEVLSSSSYTFTHDLILTPNTTNEFTNEYSIAFIDQNPDAHGNITQISQIGDVLYTRNYDYRDTASVPATREVPEDVSGDLQYSYEFLGWSTVTPINGRYHVLLEDGDFDVNGTAVGINSDWIVRNNATYYAVYRRHIRSYTVRFWYTDATATTVSRNITIKYGEKLTPPTEYVPYTYATGGFGYTFANWKYTDGNKASATLGYADSITFTKEYIDITLSAVAGSGGAIAFQAAYGTGVPTPYTVTFNYRNDEGEVVTDTAEVKHGEYITQEMIDALAPATEYDNGEALVTYTGSWTVVEGAAAQTEYETSDLTSFSPTSHITFEAVYGNPKPFYTVTYIDGANTYSERVLEGNTLPAWTYEKVNDNGTPDNADDDYEEEVVYVPSMADDARGSYEFQGWFDAKQADTTYNAVNGNKYEATTAITSDVTLYPQFKFKPFTYEIRFMDYEGKVQLAAGKFEYGQNIEAVTAVANKAAQGRAQDDTYTYTFIGWDQKVPTICEGKDMVFIAQYKSAYRYYNAKWYNSEAEMSGDALTTTHHTYNSKVYAPSVVVTPPADNADGTKNIFAGWYYKDANGEEQKYVRGMLITGEMSFYAKYTATKKTFIVTTVVDGVETEYTVADGDKAVIADPQSGYVDSTKHNEFNGWYTDSACTEGKEFDIDNTLITADTKIYAKFTVSDHDYTNKQLKTSPTYYSEGVNEVWCSCDPTQTKKDEAIAKLTDTKAPTATIYLGTLGSWSSEGTAANVTDNNPVELYANENTDVIITANDTGDVNALYNPSGIGKGVKIIKAFAFPGETALTATNYAGAQEVAVTVYEDATENLTNTANFVVKLGDIVVADLAENGDVQYNDDGTVKTEKLQDGETYIIYYYVTDKAGNMLNRKVRTAKFIYDITEPTFTVEGKTTTEAVVGTRTYCEKATVTGVEVGATLTVNGEAVELTTTSAAGTGTYTITETGNYLITVTDKAGNSASKKIKVASHEYDEKTKDVTCTEDGYKKEVCILCGDVKTEETYTHVGHVWGTPAITSATCTENGYSERTCEVCGLTEKAVYEVDENGDYVLEDGEEVYLFPALGHIYEKDAAGEIVYTTVTAATCRTKGKAIANCTECGAGTLTKELPIDDAAHKLGTLKTLEATCTAAGQTYKICKLCTAHIKVSDLPMVEHTRDNWVVVTEASCYADGLEKEVCSVCNQDIATGNFVTEWVTEADGAYEYVLDENDEKITKTETVDETETTYYQIYKTVDGEKVPEYSTRPIAKTGKHVKVEAESKEPTGTEKGYIKYKCQTEGCTWTETVEIDMLVYYTVKFVEEDGTTEIDSFTKLAGETIAADAVTVPTKTDSTGKYSYAFAGWVDEAGKAVELPFDVTGNVTLKPTFTETKNLYTHQFMVPTTWTATLDTDTATNVEFATLMGGIGDVRVPSAKPEFTHADAEEDARLKKLYTFEFKGWADAHGNFVDDFTIALDADGYGDKTFYAVFEAKSLKYKVIYYNGTDLVWNTEVEGGESVEYANKDSEGNVVYPEKNFDSNYHYAFDKWYTNNTLTVEYKGEAITADTRLYAGFTATAHSYDKSEGKGTVIQAQSCVDPEITEYKCTVCDNKITEQTKDALGHDMGEYVYDEATGNNVSTCSRCDYTHSVNASCTIKFANENGLTLELVSNVKIGDKVKYSKETPVKNATAQHTYEFAGWVDEDGNKYAADAEFTAAADAVYTAYYTETVRKYRVSYVGLNNEIIKYTEGDETKSCTYELDYKAAVPAYPENAPAQVKDSDDGAHYIFKGWSVEAGTEVTGDIAIRPVFESIAHTWVKTEESADATCTQSGGDVWKCTGCGLERTQGGSPATGHKMVQSERVEPDYDKGIPGYVVYTCKNGCGKTETEVLSAELIDVVITVNDANGNPKQGVEVALVYAATPNVAVDGTHTLTTGADGKVTFHVKPGDYLAKIGTEYQNVTVDNDRNVTGGNYTEAPEEVVIPTCSCSCHRDGFWGIVFRFFHKIIGFFAGGINCCSCPDPRY